MNKEPIYPGTMFEGGVNFDVSFQPMRERQKSNWNIPEQTKKKLEFTIKNNNGNMETSNSENK